MEPLRYCSSREPCLDSKRAAFPEFFLSPLFLFLLPTVPLKTSPPHNYIILLTQIHRHHLSSPPWSSTRSTMPAPRLSSLIFLLGLVPVFKYVTPIITPNFPLPSPNSCEPPCILSDYTLLTRPPTQRRPSQPQLSPSAPSPGRRTLPFRPLCSARHRPPHHPLARASHGASPRRDPGARRPSAPASRQPPPERGPKPQRTRRVSSSPPFPFSRRGRQRRRGRRLTRRRSNNDGQPVVPLPRPTWVADGPR